MRQSVPVSRLLKSGDFIIRFDREKQIWNCWLIGIGAPYEELMGEGKFPLQAMRDWNTKAHFAKDAARGKTELPKTQVKRRWMFWK